LAIYSYFAEAEREFISVRTKQGLAAARASGTKLGRPRGRKNKVRILDPYRGQIARYLRMGLNLAAILTVVNDQLPKPITYPALRYYVEHDAQLQQLRKMGK
jgi:DNA invertase Pin-like site-specific DNA recombinase